MKEEFDDCESEDHSLLDYRFRITLVWVISILLLSVIGEVAVRNYYRHLETMEQIRLGQFEKMEVPR